MVTQDRTTSIAQPNWNNSRIWFAPDRKAKTRAVADHAVQTVHWIKTGRGFDDRPNEQDLFRAMHACAFQATKRYRRSESDVETTRRYRLVA